MALFRSAQRWPSIDEPEELRCVEHELIEEGYTKFIDLRGIDLGQNSFQIFTVPLKLNCGEIGEDRACQRRQTLTF